MLRGIRRLGRLRSANWSGLGFRSFATEPQPRVLVVGAHGQLGRDVVNRFTKHNWNVLSVEHENKRGLSKVDVELKDVPLEQQINAVSEAVGDEPLDAVVCAAGGWAGTDLDDSGLLSTSQQMFDVCLQPSLLSAAIAHRHAHDENGLLLLFGAQPEENVRDMAIAFPEFNMVYGAAKLGVHQIGETMFHKWGSNELNKRVSVICPTVIDTASNREAGIDLKDAPSTDELAQLVYNIAAETPFEDMKDLYKIDDYEFSRMFPYSFTTLGRSPVSGKLELKCSMHGIGRYVMREVDASPDFPGNTTVDESSQQEPPVPPQGTPSSPQPMSVQTFLTILVSFACGYAAHLALTSAREEALEMEKE